MENKDVNYLVAKFGPSGVPKGLDENLIPSWNAYSAKSVQATPRDRVMCVLGFLHLLNQAGQRIEVNPYKAYIAILSSDFDGAASILAQKLRSMRVFDLFRIDKTLFSVDPGLRDNREVSFDFSVSPKRTESLDSALHKAEGFLYSGELPIFLKERWKKLSVTSKGRPKSDLPRSVELMKSSSVINRLPLYIGENSSLHVSRSSDGKIVFKFRLFMPNTSASWLTRHQHQKLLQKLWSSSLKNIKG